MRFCDGIKDLVTGFGIAEILIGFFAILTIPMFARIFFQIESPAFRGSEATSVWLKFTYSSLAMLLPTLIMGATFPIASKIYTSLNQVGRSIGNIYSINTVGAILGSATAGFVLIPVMGIQKSILLLAAVNIAIGIILIASSPYARPKSKYAFLAPIVILAVILGAVVPVSGKIFSSVKRPAMPQGNSIYYREGVTHIVEIIEDVKDGTRHLILDGGINASTAPIGVGMRVHMLMAELPLLLHEDPKSILLIALGSGMTAGATLAFESLETIDCAEISPDVVSAADYFAPWNHDVVNSPRFNLYIEDGRNFILTTPQKYDVITTGIIHPKHSAGNAGLYSKDYYEICKSKLNPGGVICQWAPLNGLTVKEFRMILKTFQEVFPKSTLWFAQTFGSWGNVNALLIGTRDELRIDYNRLQMRFQKEKISSDLNSQGIDNIFQFLDCFIMADSMLASLVSGQIEITTDDRPLLEFGDVEMHYSEILSDLAARREPIWPHLTNTGKSPEDSTGIYVELKKYFRVSNKCIQGDIEGLGKDYNQAIADYGAAIEMAPENEDVRRQLLELQKKAHNFLVKRFIKQRIRFPSDVEQYLRMLEINPDDAEAMFRIGYLYQQADWLDAAISQYQSALRLEPNNLQVRHNLAVVYDNKGKTDKAIEELEVLIGMKPSFSKPYAYLGFIYERQADTARAIELFEKALQVDSTDQTAKRHLSKLKGEPGRDLF
jgi:spermidine synthase